MHSDPFFGDTRIDMDIESRAPSPPPPPGPPSRQNIVLADEDMTLRLTGCQIVPWKQFAWTAGSLASFGVLALLGRWSPRLWLGWATQEKAFRLIEEGFVVIEVCLTNLLALSDIG